MKPSQPPDYLVGKVTEPDWSGPSAELKDGSWCGHGEPKFRIFDVGVGGITTNQVLLPSTDADTGVNLPVVRVIPCSGKPSFLVYDSRKHPSSMFAMGGYENQEPLFDDPLQCQNCNSDRFRLSVGFEIPVDSQDDNDTTWFALAGTCATCGASGLIYEDETC
jgi:hypothetical protein